MRSFNQSGPSSEGEGKSPADLLVWLCGAILLFMLLSEFAELLKTAVWRHDDMRYLSSYMSRLKEEGRWLNYAVFDTLRELSPHLCAVLCVLLWGCFSWEVCSRFSKKGPAFVAALAFMQIHPLWSIIHWPQTSLPGYMCLAVCAALSRKYDYKVVFIVGAVLFHGTFNNLYNVLPLLFMDRLNDGRKAFSVLCWWVFSFVAGFVAAQLIVRIISGGFIHAAPWRDPQPLRDWQSLVRNVLRACRDFMWHLRTFSVPLACLCLCSALFSVTFCRGDLWKLFFLVMMGGACYVQAIPMGLGVAVRTAQPLYAALLMCLCLNLQRPSLRWLCVLLLLTVSGSLFVANIQYLRYFNGVLGTWAACLRKIPVDPSLYDRVIFLSTGKECWLAESLLKKRKRLYNKISDGVGSLPLWAPAAREWGAGTVIYAFPWVKGMTVEKITPEWFSSLSAARNELYEWQVHEGTIAVRFNPVFFREAGKGR